jgi:threonylcarbamoyladenosine tRNA methylthiotransferase CDKAL1
VAAFVIARRRQQLLGDTGSDGEEPDEAAPELEDLDRSLAAGAGRAPRTTDRVRRRGGAVEPSQGQGDLPGNQKVFVKTFGCAHNSSDSEFMAGLLSEYGYHLTESIEEADVCVINSCTVKNPSQDSAVNLTKKAQDTGKQVVLTGCVPSADKELVNGLDGVSILDVTQLERIVEVVEEAAKGNTIRLLGKRKVMPTLELPKVRRNSCVEIIPISGGCLGNCSYCKTKHARGKLSSYSEADILNRAKRSASEGVSEVWLTSEDTGAYGLDIGTNIANLLRQVADSLPEGVMLKLGMTNPPYMLAHIDAVADILLRPNVFEFIHIPVQSGSNEVLRSMIREYTREDFKRLVDGLRARVPNLCVSTDVICGFPSEAEEHHRETLSLVEEYKFPTLNISQFYARPGTAAARMKKLPGNVVKRRSSEMTQLFESYTTNDHLVGTEARVWFSDSDARHNQTVGHTKGYVKVVVPKDDSLLGRSAMVRIDSSTKWHVQATILNR